MERAMVKAYSPTGQVEQMIVMRESRPLNDGKTAPALFGAGAEYLTHPRLEGHLGYLHEHFVFDGALADSQEELFACRRATLYDPEFHVFQEADRDELEQKDLLTMVVCVLHTMQNGLKWSLARFIRGFVIDDLHKVVRSLRSCFWIVHATLKLWLLKVVSFEPFPFDIEVFRVFWRMLGVSEKWMPEFLAVRPWWRNHRLLRQPRPRERPRLPRKGKRCVELLHTLVHLVQHALGRNGPCVEKALERESYRVDLALRGGAPPPVLFFVLWPQL